MLPWCMAIWPASSGAASSMRWYHISLWLRTLVKMSVLWLALMMGMILGNSGSPKWPAHG